MTADTQDWNLSIDSSPVAIGTITMPASSAGVSTNFTLPANATGIMVQLINSAPTANVVPGVVITGGVSSTQYATSEWPGGPSLTGGGVVCIAAIPGDSENPITVSVIWNNTTGSPKVVGTVYALIAAGITQVVTPPQQPLSVALAPPGGQNASSPLQTVAFNLTLAANTTSSLVAGLTGRQWLIYQWNLSIAAGSAASAAGYYGAKFTDTLPLQTWGECELEIATEVSANSQQTNGTFPLGLPLPLNRGFGITSLGNTSNIVLVGSVIYAQL